MRQVFVIDRSLCPLLPEASHRLSTVSLTGLLEVFPDLGSQVRVFFSDPWTLSQSIVIFMLPGLAMRRRVIIQLGSWEALEHAVDLFYTKIGLINPRHTLMEIEEMTEEYFIRRHRYGLEAGEALCDYFRTPKKDVAE